MDTTSIQRQRYKGIGNIKKQFNMGRNKIYSSHVVRKHIMFTVKFLNFRIPENFAVIYLKFKQRGKTGYFVKKMQMEKQTLKTQIRLLYSRSSLIWVCTVCPDLYVQKLRIITVYLYTHITRDTCSPNNLSVVDCKHVNSFCIRMLKALGTNYVQACLSPIWSETHMSCVMRKSTFWFPFWSDTNKAVQPQKMARCLKFRIKKVEGLYYLCSENKDADQLRGYREADLRLCVRICNMLVFSIMFSHDKDDIFNKSQGCNDIFHEKCSFL